MCQLMFVNLHNSLWNQIIGTMLSFEDSYTDNRHGFGIYSTAGLIKKKEPPDVSLTFSDSVLMLISKNPAILHVRSSSKGQDVKDEFNHPFESEDIVIAHNGTLEPRKATGERKDLMDTQVFLAALQANYSNSKASPKDKMLTALQETMKEFYGKFAFLIYEKPTKRWYAARGATADLHVIYGLTGATNPDGTRISLGYVVNTNKSDLLTAISKTEDVLKVLNQPELPAFSEVYEIEKESVYLLDKFVPVKIGELKQNYAPVAISEDYGRTWIQAKGILPASVKQGGEEVSDDTLDQLENFSNRFFLTTGDIDCIMWETMAISLLEATQDDLNFLVKEILPRILRCPKKVRKVSAKIIRDAGKMSLEGLYAIYPDLQFPYTCERSPARLESALSKRNAERVPN